MKLLGIDPGYERCGVAVLEKKSGERDRVIFSGCIRTNARDTFQERLHALGKELSGIITTYQPDTVAIEQLYFAKNTKTAMLVAEARGVIQYVIATHGLECVEYHPNTIKIAITGHGGADKQDVAGMVGRLVDVGGVGASGASPQKLDDELDAIAIALTHSAHLKNTWPQ